MTVDNKPHSNLQKAIHSEKQKKILFSTIGNDIWIKVDHIRTHGNNASQIGKIIETKQQTMAPKMIKTNFPFASINNIEFQSETNGKSYINKVNNEKLETINLQNKPLMQVYAKFGNLDSIATIDNGAQRTLISPSKFKQIKKKLKIVPMKKDSILQSVNGNILEEEGRYLLKDAISFNENQLPEDIEVIVCSETPFPILLGLPQLRKWNSHIIHAENLSSEMLIVQGFYKQSANIKRKIQAVTLPSENQDNQYVSIALSKDIIILPFSGKNTTLQPDCDTKTLKSANFEFNPQCVISVSPCDSEKDNLEETDILIEISYKKGPNPYIDFQVINNSHHKIKIHKTDIIALASTASCLKSEHSEKSESKSENRLLRNGSIIQNVADQQNYLVKSMDENSCVITHTDNVFILEKDSDKTSIKLGIEPNSKTYTIPKGEVSKIHSSSENGICNIFIEKITNINSLPESISETEHAKNTDDIRKKLLSAITIGNFGTDPVIKKRAQDILWKHRYCFSRHRMDIGRVRKDFYLHDVTPLSTMPATKRFPPFRFSAEEKLTVEKYMKMLEKAKVQKPNIPSPYSLPCFLIDKADTLPTFEHNEKKDEEATENTEHTVNEDRNKSDPKPSEPSDPLQFEVINIDPDGNCLFESVRQAYKEQFPNATALPDTIYLRDCVADLGKIIASEQIQAAVKLKKEEISKEWDKIKSNKIWWTNSPVADVILPTLSQWLERPLLLIQEDTIQSINGVETLEQPPNCINSEPIVITRNAASEHFNAVKLKCKSVWHNISKSMITKNITSIDQNKLHSLCPEDVPPPDSGADKNNESTDHVHTGTEYTNKTISGKQKRAKRVLIDARYANKHIEMQIANLPVIEELLETFSYPNIVTGSLDLTQFYWQIPVTEQYGKIFTVSTHLGTHTPQVVQQGDMCAVRAAQETIKKIIKDIPGVSALIDDIAITAPTPTEFLDRLEMILDRLEKCADPEFGPSLKIRGDKTVILSDNISYMGFMIIKGHLYADKTKAEKILNWKIPESLTDLQSYCSFISYFRIFFKNTSTKIQPILDLEKLPKYKKTLHWEQKHQDIFDQVKHILTNLPALKIIDTSPTAGTLHIHHDWSSKGYGALLSQETKNLETGKTSIKPIQYFSRLSKKAELRYKVSEGEMNSAVAAINKWNHYLRGKRFILHSDSSVVYHVLKNYKNTSRVLGRLAADIQGMCFKVKHVSTKENPADYFSRNVTDEERIDTITKEEPLIPDLTSKGDVIVQNEPYETEEYDDEDTYESDSEEEEENPTKDQLKQTNVTRNCIIKEVRKSIEQVQPILLNYHNKPEYKELIAPVITRNHTEIGDVLENVPELFQKQRADLYINEIIKHLSKVKSKDATYKHHRYTYKLISGLLLAKYDEGPFRYVAPNSMKREIVRAKHGLLHCGVEKTEQLIRSTWIFPGLGKLVKQMIKSCYTCQSFGSNPKYPHNKHNPLQHLKASKPLEIIAIDVWSSGKQDSRFKYVVCAIDLFSRFCWSKCITRATSDVISDFLIENVFTTGIPRRILSDNAENISAGSLPHLYDAINIGFKQTNINDTEVDETPIITQTTSTAYWPMSNSVIERIFRNFGDWIRKVITTHPEEFYKVVPVATLIYNTTNHRALGTSPAHIHFGIKPEESLPDVYQLLANGGYNSPNHYIRQRATDCKQARQDALHLMNKELGYYEQMEIQFNGRNEVRWHDFQIGDWVMVYRPPDNKQKLGTPYFMGPATITELVGNSCVIVEYWTNGIKKRRNTKHL